MQQHPIINFELVFFCYFREAQSTKVTIACAVFLTYPLQAYPAVEILLPVVQKRFPEKFEVITELAFRYLMVLFTCKYLN